jgi:hypothetical protein
MRSTDMAKVTLRRGKRNKNVNNEAGVKHTGQPGPEDEPYLRRKQ